MPKIYSEVDTSQLVKQSTRTRTTVPILHGCLINLAFDGGGGGVQLFKNFFSSQPRIFLGFLMLGSKGHQFPLKLGNLSIFYNTEIVFTNEKRVDRISELFIGR